MVKKQKTHETPQKTGFFFFFFLGGRGLGEFLLPEDAFSTKNFFLQFLTKILGQSP